MSITVDPVVLPAGWTALDDWGPGFSTTVLEQSSGFVDVLENWPLALWGGTIRYVKGEYETLDVVRLDQAYRFFLNRHGMGRGFLVEDPLDNTDAKAGGTGVIEQVNGVWRLTKHYSDGYASYVRLITRPQSSVVASSGTVGALGVVTGIAATGTWTGNFWFPARFGMDKMHRNIGADGLTEWSQVLLQEVRES